MTDNKGQTWQSFEMPAPPAFVGNPFSFHSDPKKYDHVLYLGTVCEKDGILGWFGSCMDVVSRVRSWHAQSARSHRTPDILHHRQLWPQRRSIQRHKSLHIRTQLQGIQA